MGGPFKRKPAAALACLFVLAGCSQNGSWDQLALDVRSLGWQKRISIDVDTTSIAEPLVDFPLLVTLTPARLDYADFQPDGRDIGFYSAGGDLLDYEVDTWSPGGISRIWVRLPLAPAGGGTRIWMRYSSLGQAPRQNPAGVWRNGYAAVWHLSEHATAGERVFRDSSASGCDGRGGWFPSTTPPAATDGRIGDGQLFGAGGTEGFAVPGTASLDGLGPVTWSFWLLHPGASQSGDRLFSKGSIRVWVQGGNLLKLEVTYSAQTLLKEYGGAWISGAWQCMSLSWDGTPLHAGVRLYRNGIPLADSNRRDAAGSRSSDAGNIAAVGNGDWAGADRSFGAIPDGAVLDEVRISRTVRSADWVRADYLSMMDQLITYGTPELIP